MIIISIVCILAFVLHGSDFKQSCPIRIELIRIRPDMMERILGWESGDQRFLQLHQVLKLDQTLNFCYHWYPYKRDFWSLLLL